MRRPRLIVQMPHLMPPLFFALRILAFLALLATSRADDEVVVEIKAIAGLRYDVPRFVVPPNVPVRLEFSNADDMAHNLVITAPGARMEIVTAAMTMPLTPEQTFIPPSDKVLWHVPVLVPGKSATLKFTAPSVEGVYPYVCTYPGHGLIMFGAMYVSTAKKMPPLVNDNNVPEIARETQAIDALHAFPPQPPYVYRTFMRDCGPAAIAVALPDSQNYGWDAGACRLRYVWRGGFVDPRAHWGGNGDAFAEVTGRIYYRAEAGFPLRLGSADKVPKVKFRGYRLMERYPEFQYEMDGVEVRELIKPLHHGGFSQTFTIGQISVPLYFVSGQKTGATLTSSAGAFQKGILELAPLQARQFTITYTEIPNEQPIGYWSMDDVLKDKRPLPVAGVKGRALLFDGKKSEFATGLRTAEIKESATLMLWVKAKLPAAADQVAIGVRAGGDEFALGWNLGGGRGMGWVARSAATQASADFSPTLDDRWHQLAVTVNKGEFATFFDGQRTGSIAAKLPPDAPIFIGSVGGAKFGAATLDEVRIYARALSDAEIRAQFESDQKPTSPPPAL